MRRSQPEGAEAGRDPEQQEREDHHRLGGEIDDGERGQPRQAEAPAPEGVHDQRRHQDERREQRQDEAKEHDERRQEDAPDEERRHAFHPRPSRYSAVAA